jgi:short-subunit dehydrogenase
MNKVVLITGASSGIGKSAAEYLSDMGLSVYGTSRLPEKYPIPENYLLLALDINNEESIINIVKKIIEKEKKIDILINNAGVGITGPAEEININAMQKNFNTNFFGPVRLMQEILPYMRINKTGTIINITSIAGYMGLPFRGPYSASKAAMEIFTESIRMEVKRFGINVSTLAPGEYATNIASRRYHSPVNKGAYEISYKESLDKMNDHVKGGNNPYEVAKAIFKIINKQSPNVHYRVGAWFQKLSIFLKKILPDFLYEKILMKFYKL